MKQLRGKLITLIPLSTADKDLFYIWAAHSDITDCLFDKATGAAVPTREQFFETYQEYYFDGSQPLKGRCFGIEYKNRFIGQVNYHQIELGERSVELDVWIANETDTGKGCGPDALQTLAEYLFTALEVQKCFITPAADNEHAVKAFQKAGFEPKHTFDKNGMNRQYMVMQKK